MPEPDPSQIIPRTAMPHETLRAALDALDRGRRVVLASVVARHGSAPSTPGQKLCLLEDLTAVGTIGGGAVEILVEPMFPAVHVLVIGAGHVGAFAAPLLASLGFRVLLCDARQAAADPARLTPLSAGVVGAGGTNGGAPWPSTGVDPVRVLHHEHDDPEVIAGLPRDLTATATLVMTYDHALDQAAIEWALARGFGFVGGVGSRAKAARTRARLEAKGVSEADIARVRMPIGVDIGARTPAEISVSLAAELIAWRAGRQQARWAATASPVAAASSSPEDVARSAQEQVDR